MTDRYATIIARCLEVEDKTHRDAVLNEYPDQAVTVRKLLSQIGRRLTAFVARGEDRAERKRRLDAIREPWLRDRVEAMVRERFAEGAS